MILSFVEHTADEILPQSLEALTLARQLGDPVEAVVIGPGGRDAAAHLRDYGVTTAHVVADDRLDAYAPVAWAESLSGLIDALAPAAVVAASTQRGNEVLAHVGAIRDLPLAVNCLKVEPGDPYVVTRQRWGGSLLEEARLNGAVKLLTTAAGAFAPSPAPAAAFDVREVAPSFSDNAFRVQVKEVVAADSGKVSLGEARVVVGGGRGVGSAEGFATLEELAAVLGAAVGCSRAVTSNGWRPHAEQIGQTGERITAELYIACGISGAMQHIVGAKGAKHILAINTDPDATIMNYAEYAVIGDLHQVVPAVVAELKKAQGG